jgi:hypothetical protein
MGRNSHKLTRILAEIAEEELAEFSQREDSLYFDFNYLEGHPKSEELKEWFDLHKVDFFVAEQNLVGLPEKGGVDFRDRPDLAVLFKLRFL